MWAGERQCQRPTPPPLLGPPVTNKCLVEKWEEGEAGQFSELWREQELEMRVVMSVPVLTLSHVCACDLMTTRVYADVWDLLYHH